MNLATKFTAALIGAGVIGSFSAPARAQDASFGCKVLLCAAATNPDWSGVSYCVPVMRQLFSQIARGDGWPSCSAANESGLAYQPYLACPAGSSPYTNTNTAENSSADYVSDPNGDVCISAVAMNNSLNECNNAGNSGGTGGCTHPTPPSTPRPLSPKPYSITISPPGQPPFTFSFALND